MEFFQTNATYTHMPFTATYDDQMLQLCCIRQETTDRWHIYYKLNDQDWTKLTDLGADYTECSPAACYDSHSKDWVITFIAGHPEEGIPFALYKMYGFKTSPIMTLKASGGFSIKNNLIVVLPEADHQNIVKINSYGARLFRISDIKYIYRLSYVADAPHKWLISAQTFAGDLVCFVYDSYKDTLHRAYHKGAPPYKFCINKEYIFYAAQVGDTFEGRKIVQIPPQELDLLPEFEHSIEISDFDLTQIQE